MGNVASITPFVAVLGQLPSCEEDIKQRCKPMPSRESLTVAVLCPQAIVSLPCVIWLIWVASNLKEFSNFSIRRKTAVAWLPTPPTVTDVGTPSAAFGLLAGIFPAVLQVFLLARYSLDVFETLATEFGQQGRTPRCSIHRLGRHDRISLLPSRNVIFKLRLTAEFCLCNFLCTPFGAVAF